MNLTIANNWDCSLEISLKFVGFYKTLSEKSKKKGKSVGNSFGK